MRADRTAPLTLESMLTALNWRLCSMAERRAGFRAWDLAANESAVARFGDAYHLRGRPESYTSVLAAIVAAYRERFPERVVSTDPTTPTEAQIAACMGEAADYVDVVRHPVMARELAATLATRDATIATLRAESQRLRDLVRHQRGELHDAGLITDEEYDALATDSGAVARLEGYDTLRARVAELEGAPAAFKVGDRVTGENVWRLPVGTVVTWATVHGTWTAEKKGTSRWVGGASGARFDDYQIYEDGGPATYIHSLPTPEKP